MLSLLSCLRRVPAVPALVATLLVGCSDRSRVDAPDLVVFNADVRTADSNLPRAEGFAVSGGRFVAIGSSDAMRDLAGDETELIDAGAVTILPGFVDGHTHLVSGAGFAVGVDLSEIEDKAEWLRIVREKATTLPEGSWILGGGWNHNLSDGVLPTKEMLDRVAPNHPVWLRDIDGHTGWANSLAIELAGVTADTPVPPGGEIVVDPDSGELTGIFKEGASYVFGDAPGMADATDPVAGIKAAMRLANSLGITTVHDMSGNVDAFLQVLDDGEFTLRVWQGLRPRRPVDARPGEILAELAAVRERVSRHAQASAASERFGPLFQIGYVKLIIDGVLSTWTALMQAPYSDNPDVEVEPFSSAEELHAMIAASHAERFPVAVHAIGDEGVSWVLDGFAASRPAPGMPPDRVEHIEVVAPEDIERFAELGVAASMQPHHATCCVGDYVVDRIGRERMPNAYAWRAMLDGGVMLVLGSDWPTSPLDPLVQIADTIHRETRIDGTVRPWDEGATLTFDEALHGYTAAGAAMTSWNEQIGSIATGKFADFIMLDERLPENIGAEVVDRSVAGTWLAGVQVYPEPGK